MSVIDAIDIIFRQIQPVVNQQLEKLRLEKKIGKSIDAQIVITYNNKFLDKFDICTISNLQHTGLLATSLNVSRVYPQYRDLPDDIDFDISVESMKDHSLKFIQCARCYKWVCFIYHNICERCATVMIQEYPNHPETPKIIAAYSCQQLATRTE